MKLINNNQLRITNINEKVVLKGWVANKRNMGELIFIDLRDRWGITQVICQKSMINSLSKESVIQVEGTVQKRKDVNTKLATGKIEVIASNITILAKSEVVPFVIRDDLEAKEDTRLKYRYLDLRRSKMQKNLILRHKVIKYIRDFLDQQDFIEVETPILCKSTPEGARDYLVPTRNKNKFFALPQSPQIYKQLLMASGLEKYFQIARAFRDEDLRSDRQPEFTQLDMEMSFTSQEAIQKLIEDLFKDVFKKLNLNIKVPFKHLDYDEAIDKYGSDKPDLRFENILLEVSDLFKNTKFNAFKKASNIKALFIKKLLNKKQIKKLEEVAKKNKASGLAWITLNDGVQEWPGAKFFLEEVKLIQNKFKNNQDGTWLFVADEYRVTTQALGAVRVELNKMFNLAKEEFNFTWIENWPLFEHNDESNRYIAAHHPFTAPADKDIDSFSRDQKNAKAKAYDLVLNGYEIGGGSIRINDAKIQERMFEAIGMSKKVAQSQFGFFLEAFKYGLPPHGGIAFGLDRILMILAHENSIREVIAFPKNANGVDVMSESPSDVTLEQLEEYKLKIKNKE